MAELLLGAPVAEHISQGTRVITAELRDKGIDPTLAIVRVGERPDDLSYERGAILRCSKVGITVKQVTLPADISQADFDEAFTSVNADPSVHGILLFAPLPRQLSYERARQLMDPAKDVDGCTLASMAGVYAGTGEGYAPCTAQAVIEILRFYNIPMTGSKAAVLGRSLIIGRPVSAMLMQENATVTTCHTKTRDAAAIARAADILVAAVGHLRSVTADYTNPDQVVIDVGVNWDEAKGGIAGDVDYEAVEPACKAITPVPRGVGSVTTSVLASHVAEAARRASEQQ